MASASASVRPYRFPAPEEDEPTGGSAGQSYGTCGASAVASCVALCFCPCAVVSCLTLALVKAPYAAGRRCVVRLTKRRVIRGSMLRKTKRVRNVDGQEEEGLGGGTPRARVSKEWGELAGWAGASWSPANAYNASAAAGEGRMRVSATEKVWVEMYEVGHWGFGRLSFSAGRGAAALVVRGDPEKDGNVFPAQ